MMAKMNKKQSITANLIYSQPAQIAKAIEQLNQQEVLGMVDELTSNQLKYSTLWKLTQTRYTILKYVNKAKRQSMIDSLFIYSKPEYVRFECGKLPVLALGQNSTIFYQFPNKFNQILNQCQNCVKNQIRQQFGLKLEQLFLDPSPPMMSLIKQSIGTDPFSQFQNFLLSRITTGRTKLPFPEDVFYKAVNTIEEDEQKLLVNLIKNGPLMSQLRQSPHLINYDNYKNKLIKNNSLHNLIVLLLALTELQLSAVQQYLSAFTNPFQLLLQISQKYHLFIVSVIEVQNNLGQLFSMYDGLHNQLFNKNYTDKFCYWKPALTMWIKKMNFYHTKCQPIFAILVQQSYHTSFSENLNQPHYQKIASKYYDIMDQTLSSQSINLNSLGPLYEQMTTIDSEIQSMISYYQACLIDLSITESSIYTCGYSKQQLGPIFTQALLYILNIQRVFFQNLKRANISQEEQPLFRKLLKQRLLNYQSHVKPVVCASIADLYKAYCGQDMKMSSMIKKRDEQIQRYIQSLIKSKQLKVNQKVESMYNLAFNKTGISETHTNDNSEISDMSQEFGMDMYDSQSEMDIEESVHHQLSKSIN